MLAAFHNFSLIEHADLIRILNRGKTVRNGNGSAGFHQALQSLLHQALRLRIQRHKKVETSEILRFGGLEIDLGLREARFNGEAAPLTALEFDLLAFLARNPDQVFSYEQLHDRVWKAPMNQGLHNIQVCMARVRQKLDALCPGLHWIETVRRKGYRFNSGAEA